VAVAQQADSAPASIRQPSLASGGERRRIERRLREAAIWCHPEVSLQYQRLAQRAVLRGVESGGATKEIGRYVTFCDESGGQLGWLQPIDSIGSNGRHAIVIAASLVSVEVFRVRNTYEILIARHSLVQEAGAERPHVQAAVVFRGHEGYLPLDLTGSDKAMAGRILPEFFNRAGERIEIPGDFTSALKAAVLGASCLLCTHQHYVTAPKAGGDGAA
jgi:hypothetical protein